MEGCPTLDRVISVGPFKSSFGGRPPAGCKSLPGLMAEAQIAHGAVWGVRMDEVAKGEAASRHAAMLQLVRNGADTAAALPLLPVRTDGPSDWVTRYRPHLVLVVLGTNDLHAAEPSEVFARLVTLTNPLLALAGGDDAAAACRFRVVISSLPVHFATDPPPPIGAYNALLRRFNDTGRQAAEAGCPPPTTPIVNRLDCSRCVRFIDGAGKAFARETKSSIMAVTYDAIHPNAEGERRIAEAIFDALVAQNLV